MAKDGTNRGNRPGNYNGAGRKKKPLADKIAEGRTDMTVLTLPEPPELTAFEIPPVEEYMKAQQKNGRDLCAEERYMRTWQWLRERRCEKLVNPQLVEQYAMSVARWIQCEEALSEFGFLAKHPTTGNAIASPFIKTLQDFIKQSNMLWAQIYTVVQDNCSEQYSGPNPQDDVMERLLTMKRRREE